jgi:methylated-DNA-[protein]-cysteine S-methyltransferase
MTTFSTLDSPVGELLLVGDDDGLRGLYLPEHKRGPQPAPHWRRDDAALTMAREQLGEYFAGRRTEFDLDLDPVGTPFQLEVWDALREIPYGETISYGQLAAIVGRPSAARAVGAANGRNPISIVVPCHRVVGSTGTLTGYAGGVAVKERLLALEATSAFAAR